MAATPYSIAEAFERIENALLDSMMRNFKRHRAEETAEGYNWTAWQTEQLKALNEYKKRNRAVFPKQFAEINQKIDELIDTTAKDGEASAEAEILKAIRKGAKIPHKPTQGIQGEFFKLNDRKLDALIKATHRDFVKAEHAILRRADDIYRKTIFNAQAYANTGAGTYAQAVDMAVRDMMRAGLDCVEYKNGARHTLSNYAEMAIRTANKRANLMGEGNKRAEWGIHTVVVNHRYGACALCAPFVGKVFIDDVYSGGKKGDGNYPLLSNAIREGLFHPNCKDGCSTWFEGISRIKPVTPEEEEEMNRREKLAARQNYYENQAEKCERIATHSLDKDNKKIYERRAKINEENAEKIAKALEKTSESGIIKAAGNNKSRNIELENIIHRCISAEHPIFAEGSLGNNALKIEPIKDCYDVVAHGTPNSIMIFDVQITPEILASIITHRKDYSAGMAIRLISCNTGLPDSQGECFAQKLSDLLNVKVSAPNKLIWVYPNGQTVVGTAPNKNDGKMIDYLPRRDKK